MAPQNSVVRMIDFGAALGAALFFILLIAFSWVTRSADERLLMSETQLVRDAFERDIQNFADSLEATTAQKWLAQSPQSRALIHSVEIDQVSVKSGTAMALALASREGKARFGVAAMAIAAKDVAQAPVELVLTRDIGDHATLFKVSTVRDRSSPAPSPVFAVEVFDIGSFANEVARFGVKLQPVRPRRLELAEGPVMPVVSGAGNIVAEIPWTGVQIAPVADRTIVPAIIVLGLIALVGTVFVRLRWREAREQFMRELQITHKQALTDPMTGLPNRRALFEHLARVAPDIGAPKKITVLVLDLDGFKLINDNHGHQAGDALIKEAAALFLEAFGHSGLVARMGGDEFVAVINEILSANALQRVYGELVLRFAERAQRERNFQKIGVSVGAVHTAAHAVGGDELIRLADIALFAAKSRGRGLALMYDPSMRSQELQSRLLERELRAGLLTGELFVQHQPVVDALSGMCLGHETLVRWKHGVRGLISPAQFIPLAEKSDLIIQIGNFVLNRSLEELGPLGDLTISVNVTGKQMLSPGFADTVEAALARHGVDPARLILELTETSLVKNADDVVAVMEHLRQRGVRFAIDDFGSGYSSLGYLLRFKFDVLKIDRDFIAALEDKPESPMIVMSIVSLARSLGMRVVGEGVETAAQHRFLASAGCNFLQGYLFGKPQSIAVIRSERREPDDSQALAA